MTTNNLSHLTSADLIDDTERDDLPETELVDDTFAGDTPTRDDSVPAPAQVLEFPSLPAWVREWLMPNWRHRLRINETHWCALWWDHPEAITRLEAVWEAYEVMRLFDAPSLSVWIKDHLDAHMTALTAPTGPFIRCNAEQGIHEQLPLWPVKEPPARFFKDASVTHHEENRP